MGTTPDQATEGTLQALIDGAVREQNNLDFKGEDYGNSDGEKREFAADIAAFANDRGGLLVIGLAEQDDIASALTPVELVDGHEATQRQIAAANIAPHTPFEVHRVAASVEEGQGYYLLEVPPSPLRPHAVRKNNDLRFPRRDGTTKRWLGEAEVADLYRDRFRAARDQTGRVQQVVGDGSKQLPVEFEAFVSVAVVPTVEGDWPIDLAQVRATEQWAVALGPERWWMGFFSQGAYPTGRVRQRRVTLNKSNPDETPYGAYAELHRDGSTFAAQHLFDARRGAGNENEPGNWFLNFRLLWAIAQSLRLAGLHARDHAGAYGDVLVQASVVGAGLRMAYLAPMGFVEGVAGGPTLEGPVSTSHTLTLDALTGLDQDLLAASRLVAADLFQAFGSPEVLHLAPNGAIRIRYHGDQQQLAALAEQKGVEVSNQTAAGEQ